MDWPRFCNEIGLTTQIFEDIQVAISKVGSKERLKPIKNELPEDVSFRIDSFALFRFTSQHCLCFWQDMLG